MQDSVHNSRVDLVDALRGFALLAIVLLHNLEHYNLYFIPEIYPKWLTVLDKGMWDISWFVMAGKAFSTFSLLFGFSYYIQSKNQQDRGKSYSWRFAWRMLVLIAISQFHAIFYNGDILLIYAVIGILLIPMNALSNRTIFIVATILLLQPLEWWRAIQATIDVNYEAPTNLWMKYAIPCKEVMKNGNFIETISSNITDGQLYNNLWQIGAGRLFQIPALFMFGLLLGRLGYFIKSEKAIRFWVIVAVCSVITLIFPLNILKNTIPQLIANKEVITLYNTIMLSLWNFTFMLALMSTFTLLWFYKGNGYKIQRFIIPYGKMSLTNYITQSIMGCGIYLNWGFGLYEYTGAIFTLGIGIAIFLLQLWFSNYWLSKYKQGPIEWVWKKLTWIKF